MFPIRKSISFIVLVAVLLSACVEPAATPVINPTETLPALPTAAPTLPPPTPTSEPEADEAAPSEPSTPPTDFVGVLQARVAAGDYTYEQGLLAILRAFAGEASFDEALGDAQPHADEASGIFELARDYLAQGDDPAVKDEIQRLLNRLIPSAEQLLPYAVPQPAPSAGKAPGLARTTHADEDCDDLWEDGFPSGQDLVCIQYTEATLTAGVGRVFYPVTWWPNDPKLMDVLAATEAMVRSNRVFAGYGQMGSVDVIFALLDYSGDGRQLLASAPGLEDDACQVVVYPQATALSQLAGVEVFRQIIAHEMFHCFQYWNIEGMETYNGNKWWLEGSAEYFGNVVYPSTNMEWDRVPDFNTQSAETPLHEMDYENTVFFQHLANEIGDPAVVGLLKSMPTSDSPQASLAVLAAYPNMEDIFHRFARDAMDQSIVDSGGDYLPTRAVVAAGDSSDIDVTQQLYLRARPFVVRRYLMRFKEEHTYKIESSVSGAAGREAARPEDVPVAWEAYPTDVDAECGEDSQLFVLTTTELGGVREVEVKVEANEKDEIECKANACDHRYMPLRAGATWTWDSGATYSITRVEGDQFSANAYMTVQSGDSRTEFVWNCTASGGLIRYMKLEETSGLAPVELELVEASGVSLPALDLLQPGREWDSFIKLDSFTTAPNGTATTGGYAWETHYTLVNTNTVEFNGKILDGLQIAQTGTSTLWFAIGEGSSKPITRNKSDVYVYVRGVGLVQTQGGSVVSYSIP